MVELLTTERCVGHFGRSNFFGVGPGVTGTGGALQVRDEASGSFLVLREHACAQDNIDNVYFVCLAGRGGVKYVNATSTPSALREKEHEYRMYRMSFT